MNSKNFYATPLTPVSWGELIDKITILQIKKERILTVSAQANVEKELHYLLGIVANARGLSELIKTLQINLRVVNTKLWDVEDEIRLKESTQEFDEVFVALARSVYKLNDQRAQIKRDINMLLSSELIEEKSYNI